MHSLKFTHAVEEVSGQQNSVEDFFQRLAVLEVVSCEENGFDGRLQPLDRLLELLLHQQRLNTKLVAEKKGQGCSGMTSILGGQGQGYKGYLGRIIERY